MSCGIIKHFTEAVLLIAQDVAIHSCLALGILKILVVLLLQWGNFCSQLLSEIFPTFDIVNSAPSPISIAIVSTYFLVMILCFEIFTEKLKYSS